MKKLLAIFLTCIAGNNIASENKISLEKKISLTPPAPRVNNFMQKAQMPSSEQSSSEVKKKYEYSPTQSVSRKNETVLEFIQTLNSKPQQQAIVIITPFKTVASLLNLEKAQLVSKSVLDEQLQQQPDDQNIGKGILIIPKNMKTKKTKVKEPAPQAPHNTQREDEKKDRSAESSVINAISAKPAQMFTWDIKAPQKKQRPLVQQEKDNLAIFVANQINHAQIASDAIDFLDQMQNLKQQLILQYRKENSHLDGNEIYALIQEQFTKHVADGKKTSSCICC